MKLDEADLFLDSLAEIITPKRAILQLELAQKEIQDNKSKSNFLQKTHQTSKDAISKISNDPNYLILSSKFDETIDLYERQLIKLELAYEMKRRYAVEVLKAQI